MTERRSQPGWRDNHPDRYAEILDGDYGPYGVGDYIHFVRFGREYRDWEAVGRGKGYVLWLREKTTACGQEIPDDWKRNPTAHPVAGIVDCEACLALEASARSRDAKEVEG